jgi:hypothetical protein
MARGSISHIALTVSDLDCSTPPQNIRTPPDTSQSISLILMGRSLSLRTHPDLKAQVRHRSGAIR